MNLCLECGLCCNGFLFQSFPVTKEEFIPFVDLNPKTKETEKGLNVSQPCVQWIRGKGCNIYDKRPSVCRKYKCKVLLRYEYEDITYEEALEKINHVKREKLLHFRNKEKLSKLLEDFLE